MSGAQLDLDPETRKTLRARHVAWTRERLRSPLGKAALRQNLEAGFRTLMRAEVRQVLDAGAASSLLEHLSSPTVLSRTVRPLVRTAVLLEIARLREDPTKLAAYVSEEARDLVDQLLERPGLMPEKLVREVLSHRAFEEMTRDVLDDALKEFSEKVNPFTAEWGLPSLLKRAGPLLGLAGMAKSFESLREEFERRLEPERKRFLQGFSRRALNLVADFMIKRNDEPQFIAVRKAIFAWLLEQPMNEIVAPTTDDVAKLGEGIGHEVTKHVANMEGVRRRRRASIDMIVGSHGKQSVEQALAVYGATVRPDFDAITEAIWPAIAVALETPEIEAFLDDMVGGFWDEL